MLGWDRTVRSSGILGYLFPSVTLNLTLRNDDRPRGFNPFLESFLGKASSNGLVKQSIEIILGSLAGG